MNIAAESTVPRRAKHLRQQPPEARQGSQASPRRRALERGRRQPGLRGLSGARSDEGRPALRPPAESLSAAQRPEGRINVTDPDSYVVKGLRGCLQGYTAQAVTNEHQVVLAAEIETVGADFGHLEPMLAATERELQAAGIDEAPEVLLADAGYWHGEQIQRLTDRGIEVLIPPDTGRHRVTRRNWEGGRYEQMRELLATERGSELYGKRQPMEWRLITATHNLLKLHRHTLATA